MSEAADRLNLALSEQATFNIFSPADEDQIRVGYICLLYTSPSPRDS